MASVLFYSKDGMTRPPSTKKTFTIGFLGAASLSHDGNATTPPMQEKNIEEIKNQLEKAQVDDDFSQEAILNLKWNLCTALETRNSTGNKRAEQTGCKNVI